MRFLYSIIALVVWMWLVSNWGEIKLVSPDTVLLTFSIVFAGGLAGGA